MTQETQPKGTMKKMPRSMWIKAYFKWSLVLICYTPAWLLSFFPMGFIVPLVVRPMTNVFGMKEMEHSDKYKEGKSSGNWKYYGTNIPFIKLWSNLEDGAHGEPSGRWSSLVKGKEKTFWNRYRWVIRNPFNYGKRTMPLFACMVNDCDIKYWGDYYVGDRGTFTTGSHFCIAKHKKTKRTYYGYRALFTWEDYFSSRGKKTPKFLRGKFCNVSLGFKIKPSHADNIQVPDDRDKAFTFRIQFARKLEG